MRNTSGNKVAFVSCNESAPITGIAISIEPACHEAGRHTINACAASRAASSNRPSTRHTHLICLGPVARSALSSCPPRCSMRQPTTIPSTRLKISNGVVPTSEMGQQLPSHPRNPTSALPSEADVGWTSRHVRKGPILLQKSKIEMLRKSRES